VFLLLVRILASYAASAVVMAVLLLAWARDPASATFDKQRAWEAAKGTALVLGCWLLWLAKSGKLSSGQDRQASIPCAIA
jgi:hypothetical protein